MSHHLGTVHESDKTDKPNHNTHNTVDNYTTYRWQKSKTSEPKLYLPSTIRQKDKRMKNTATQEVRSLDSIAGIATNYAQMVQDSNSISRHIQTGPRPTQNPVQQVQGLLLGGKAARQ
jgi:hypothetical protein